MRLVLVYMYNIRIPFHVDYCWMMYTCERSRCYRNRELFRVIQSKHKAASDASSAASHSCPR